MFFRLRAEPLVAFVKESESRGERAKDEAEPSSAPSRGLQWLVGLGATLVAAMVVIVLVQVSIIRASESQNLKIMNACFRCDRNASIPS